MTTTRNTLDVLSKLALASLLFLSGVAEAAPKYKKNTVINFEGSLVEGKSRKPYSSYLSQERNPAFGSLSTWQPDLQKKLDLQKEKIRTEL